MIVRLEKEQAKQERRRLIGSNDVVYFIFNDVLKKWQKEGITELSPVELFLSAKGFARILLDLPEPLEGIDDEIEDLEEEAEGSDDAMIITMLASGILHAVGAHQAGFESKEVIKAIYSRWCDHRLFYAFLDGGAEKEQARWQEGKRTNLLEYELAEIERNGEGEEAVRMMLRDFVTMAEHLDTESIKALLLCMNNYNIEHCHKYDAEIKDLYDILNQKSITLLNAEEVVYYKAVDKQAIVKAAGAIGFREN